MWESLLPPRGCASGGAGCGRFLSAPHPIRARSTSDCKDSPCLTVTCTQRGFWRQTTLGFVGQFDSVLKHLSLCVSVLRRSAFPYPGCGTPAASCAEWALPSDRPCQGQGSCPGPAADGSCAAVPERGRAAAREAGNSHSLDKEEQSQYPPEPGTPLPGTQSGFCYEEEEAPHLLSVPSFSSYRHHLPFPCRPLRQAAPPGGLLTHPTLSWRPLTLRSHPGGTAP